MLWNVQTAQIYSEYMMIEGSELTWSWNKIVNAYC